MDNNSIDCFRVILKSAKAIPSTANNYIFFLAIEKGFVEIVDLLLKTEKIKVTEGHNKAICLANKNKKEKIIKLLWNRKEVKDTLMEDNIDLYNTIIKKEIDKNSVFYREQK